MSKFQSSLLNFAEAVLAKESGVQEGKLGSSWDLGIWLGRSTRTNEHLVGTRVGVIKARTVKRRLETLIWHRELYNAMNFVPWLIDGPVARPEAGLRTNTWMQSVRFQTNTDYDECLTFGRSKGDDGQTRPIFLFGVQTREKVGGQKWGKMQHGVRADFKQALSTLRQLKDKEDEAQSNQRWTQSYSSSWWNWQGSWWKSSYENHHEDVASTD